MSRFKLLPLLIIELLMLSLIMYFAVNIKNIFARIRNHKQITFLSKNDYVIDTITTKLKYFYEPKAGNTMISKPSWLGYEVRNTINSDTLNEEKEYTVNKPHYTYRIITLGDSFTFGQYVSNKENYSKKLEDMLNQRQKCKYINNFEVLNLGVGGYDLEYEVYRFQKRGIKYTPDLVIWLISNWNLKTINEYMIPIQESLLSKGVSNFDEKSMIYKATMNAANVVIDKYGNNIILEYKRNNFREFARLYDGNLVLITFPLRDNSYKSLIDDFIKLNSKYLHFNNIYPVPSDEKYKLLDGHPNIEGHKKMADEIFINLKDNFLSDCIDKN